MYDDLKGKTAFIMGAANPRGLGAGIAAALAAAGARVCLGDRDAAVAGAARALAERQGSEPLYVQGDLLSDSSVSRMAAAVAALCPRLDVLVQCAGCMPLRQGATADTAPEDWAGTIDLNLIGTHRLLRASVPLLRAGGSTLSLASRAAVRPLPGLCPSSAA